MSGVSIIAKVQDAVLTAMLKRTLGRLTDKTPVNKIIGSIVRTSVIRNFEKSGRPTKWKKHSKTTEAKRGKGAKILMVQGMGSGLAGSVHYKAGPDRVTVGTDKKHGATHQFGAKKGSFGTVVANIKAHMRKGVPVRAHTRRMVLPWGDIPARPFLEVQTEDWIEIKAALAEYLIK